MSFDDETVFYENALRAKKLKLVIETFNLSESDLSAAGYRGLDDSAVNYNVFYFDIKDIASRIQSVNPSEI